MSSVLGPSGQNPPVQASSVLSSSGLWFSTTISPVPQSSAPIRPPPASMEQHSSEAHTLFLRHYWTRLLDAMPANLGIHTPELCRRLAMDRPDTVLNPESHR